MQHTRDLLWQQKAKHHLKGREGGGIVWAEVGEGKSRVGLRLFAILQEAQLCLIVCRRKAFYDWENEIRLAGYKFWHVVEFNNPDKIPELIPKVRNVWLISADSLKKLRTVLVRINIDFVIIDELYLFSNVKAARTEAAIDITSRSPNCVGLSGTIMSAKDNTNIWGQTKTVGISHLLARTLTEFRSRYQYNFTMNTGVRQFKCFQNKPGSYQEILRKLDKRVYLHFPAKGKRALKHKFNYVPPTSEQSRIIKQLKEEYYAKLSEADGDELDIKVATELVIKIQQISNGWIKNNKGEIKSIASNKLDALEQSVTELLAAGERCIIWCAFRHDLEILANHFKFATLQMQGGKEFDIKAWKAGHADVVLATEGSGSSVNHFAQVAYAKYFSMSFRWLDLQQSRGRTNRRSSEHETCHYEYFFTKGTLDFHAYNTATQSGATEAKFINTGKLKQWLKD